MWFYKIIEHKLNFYRKEINEYILKIKQNFYFKIKINSSTKNLIIFFIEGPWKKGTGEIISGGITSIDSIYQITKEYTNIHHAETLICTLSGNRIFRFKTFNSKTCVLHNDQLVRFEKVNNLLLHIPEYLLSDFLTKCRQGFFSNVIRSHKVQLNILNQNIELMPSVEIIDALRKYFSIITQTTAHKKYSNDLFLEKYNIPYHFLSARIDKSQYDFVPLEAKKKLILFSPDDPFKNEKIIKILQRTLPDYKFTTIKNMSYSTYKRQIGNAKFCFTFGEGLDGYFVEPFFSGTVSFAIYNESFFEKSYKSLPTIFLSEKEVFQEIESKVLSLMNEKEYNKAVETTNELLTSDYNYEDYKDNIKKYYIKFFSN